MKTLLKKVKSFYEFMTTPYSFIIYGEPGRSEVRPYSFTEEDIQREKERGLFLESLRAKDINPIGMIIIEECYDGTLSSELYSLFPDAIVNNGDLFVIGLEELQRIRQADLDKIKRLEDHIQALHETV